MSNPYWYASMIGKLPRKRKEQRFEVRVESGDAFTAKEALIKLIKEHDIKGARAASVQLWHGHEIEFTDTNGQKQVMVMRNIFPSGSAIAFDL